MSIEITSKRGLALGSLILVGLMTVVVSRGVEASPPNEKHNPPQRQTKVATRADGDILLQPPSAQMTPRVTGEEAASVAWRDYAAYATAASASTPTLALYSNQSWHGSGRSDLPDQAADPAQLRFQNVPVWVVAFDNACISSHGPPGSPSGEASGCTNTEWNVVIDAETGEYIQGFSDR